MKHKQRSLWTCPRCRNKFVTKNIWHSCARYTLDHHFKGKDPKLRRAFEKFKTMIKRCGPIIVTSQKTRIVFQVRVRFGGVYPRKSYLLAGIALPYRSPDKRFSKIVTYSSKFHGHFFKLEKPEDLDSTWMPYFREAYKAGQQKFR